jgi:hypothetical protein
MPQGPLGKAWARVWAKVWCGAIWPALTGATLVLAALVLLTVGLIAGVGIALTAWALNFAMKYGGWLISAAAAVLIVWVATP